MVLLCGIVHLMFRHFILLSIVSGQNIVLLTNKNHKTEAKCDTVEEKILWLYLSVFECVGRLVGRRVWMKRQEPVGTER